MSNESDDQADDLEKGCRRVTTPDGRAFDIVEGSGVAAAVAAGAGAKPRRKPNRSWLAWVVAPGLISLVVALPFTISALAGHRPRTRRRAF